MRVVLDTNILFSALISPHGAPDAIYRAWRAARFEVVTSRMQLDEIRRASRYPKLQAILQPAKVGAMINNLQRAALLQRLAAVRGRLSLCADQAAAAKWWLSMPMASVSAEGPMPKALSTRRTSPLMPGCRHQGRACPLRRARMTSNPLIVA